MVNSPANINKTNNHISPQTIEHTGQTLYRDIGNPDPGLGHAQHMAELNLLIWPQSPSMLIGSPAVMQI